MTTKSEASNNRKSGSDPLSAQNAAVVSREASGGMTIEATIAGIWQETLGLPSVGREDNFFDLGGTSLLATRLLSKLNQAFGRKLPASAVFEYTTVRAMAAFLGQQSTPRPEEPSASPDRQRSTQLPSSGIAIIGMTGRFPGADSVEQFWQNLCDGVESITFFDQDQLETRPPAGAEQQYVAARPILKDVESFDAAFFGIYPKEAEQMDPQHRIFLECAWEVLERAGYDPAHTKDPVGVFAGCSMNTYFMHNLAGNRGFLEDFTGSYQTGSYVTMMGNDKDFLPTRISYKLNLRGPSIAVQSACSTSLVAVSQACQSLLTHGCDMALAGAVSVTFPQQRGYVPQEGGLASHDGHCRPFDAKASGTIFGHGAGVLLLKRLEDAVADGDQVLAVIRGFAINNDGSAKVGYTAPGVDGQAEVIARAQKMAGVPAESISYLEAHGTATPLGDPIEVAALSKAFARSTQAKQFCAIGTAKANVGHLDVAAGATGLIKTVLQIENRRIPKLLHYEQPNPHLDLENSPFFIAKEAREWKTANGPLRAGVSAFGIGGTNAHIIVEEPPSLPASSEGRKEQLLVWSAKTPTALEAIRKDLADHLAAHPGIDLADAAYTLQVGRCRHQHRCALVANSVDDALQALTDSASKRVLREDRAVHSPSVVFCFPGQGVQMLFMGRELYETELVFRDALNLCSQKLLPLLGESLIDVIYPGENTPEAAAKLNQTERAQPAIFAIEYALAQLWISWGIQPQAMVGHSVGEYVALCVAGALSLDDALHMIAVRSRLMQKMPHGSMLSVRAGEEKVRALAAVSLNPDSLDLAAVNGPQLCVVSGPDEAIAAFAAKLDGEGIAYRKLVTSHAFHSQMVEPALAPFAEFLRTITFSAPLIPVVSTVTGRWLTAGEIASTEYWTRQLRHTVRFADAVTELAKTPERIFLEVGPSETLVQLIRQVTGQTAGKPSEAHTVLASLPSSRDGVRADAAIQAALGRLWTAGADPDWAAFHAVSGRRRILLPTYPFERKKYWVAPTRGESPRVESDGAQIPQLPLASSATSPLSPEVPIMATPAAENFTMLNGLKALIADLSGVELNDTDADASFLELGFDSLFLTQLTQAIQSKYRVKLTFRQIMESYSTVDSLVAHLDSTVPAELRPAAAPVAAPAPAVVAAPQFVSAPISAPSVSTPLAPSGSIEALFAAQTQALSQLFQQQLAALTGHPVTAQAPQAAAPAPVAPPAPVSAPAPVVAAAPPVETAEAPAKPVFIPFKPIQRGSETGLNEIQQNYLRDLTAKYNKRTHTSKEFTQAHRSVFADGRVVSGFNAQIKDLIYPLVVDRASGAYLWDKDGNRYIDILNGYGAILYGHSPAWLTEALRAQLEVGFPIGPQTELAGECAELFRDLTGMERVTFCNTGSEAVMGAMRLARTVTGRNLVVVFGGDYHGSFDEVLVKAVGKHRTVPIAPGIPRESVANMLVLDYGTDESLEIIRQRAGEIAAVLVEPVQSRHPELRPVEFLREVRRITENNGAALIFDEVVTGFRTHPGGLQAVFGIKADLATYGKVVAGGLPVGVLAGRPEYMNALDGGMWQYGDASFPEAGVTFYAGTFMRHPLALAAVRACMQHLKAAGPSLQNDVAAKTSALVHDLKGMFKEFSHPSAIETFSSWFYFSVPGEPFLTRLLHFHLREQGIHIQEGFPCFLTTAHTQADFDYVRQAFRNSLEQMREGQALPLPVASAQIADISHTRLESSEAQPPASTAVDSPGSIAALARNSAETSVQAVPITEEQREILLGTQLGYEANCAFNESTSLALKGDLNDAALASAIQSLIDRHESLRLSIDMVHETARIEPALSLRLERDDLSALTADEQASQLAALIEREGSTPFDLQQAPLFRARLVRLSQHEHRLVVTAHHIVFDGWSTNVFYNELSELYNAHAAGKQPALPAALRFSEFSQKNAAQDTAEAYWLDQFRTVPSPLQIPTDRPRPALRTNRGTSRRFVIPAELAAAVRKAGARQGSTLFATLLASSALLLHRLTEQDDIVLGIPMAGQSRVENGGTLIGHSVNFLPIRSRFSADQAFAQFVKNTKTTLLDAYDNQDYTYGTLLRKLRIPRDPSRLQLIEFQVNVEQLGSALEFDNLSVDLFGNPKVFVNMDCFFNFVDRGKDIWLECDFNTDLFDTTTIERWFGHLMAILNAFVENSALPCAQISLLNAQQQQEILTDWNQTAREYPRNSSIHRVFEQQAHKTPSALAVVSDQHRFTYAELNEKANQLARFLLRSGIAPGSRVALCLNRSAEVIVSLLAILKTGAAFVPIDPTYPAPRQKYLIEDCAAPVLLTNRAIAARLPQLDTNINIISLDADWAAIAIEDPTDLPHEGSADDLAYVMYTSGSTGNPKGVLVPQRAVLRLVQNNSFASFQADEVFLQLAPLSFDASTFEIWGALLNGAQLVIAAGDRVTPEDIGLQIEQHGVTTMWLTAALFHLVVTEYIDILRPLRQLLAGGDSLSLTHVRRVCQELPQLRLINGYGPTENTTFTCCHPITLESTAQGNVPIGRPIANTRIYLLDAQRMPVPVGVAGELHAAGDGLALGYLNAPELTEQKFITHTFANGVTERLYRTGDLARYRPDGTVEFLGRIDTQVKIRGYRIELGEIEYALEQSPQVKSAVVAVRTDWVSPNDLPGDKRLVAYVIAAQPDDSAALVQELRDYLQTQLPEYMRPAAIMLVDSFPHTVNGKVDRRALPAPMAEQLIRQRAAVYPRNPIEELLAGIWEKALGLKEVSVEDSIFEVGGDSLLIFRMTTMANQGGLKVTARDFFQYKTIAAICEHLETDQEAVGVKRVGAIQAIPRSQRRQKLTSLQ
jgi:amino acid adenylation domain-containing protein